jgi:hypothetical protein
MKAKEHLIETSMLSMSVQPSQMLKRPIARHRFMMFSVTDTIYEGPQLGA